MAIKKWFCIAGPINPQIHYFIPKRLNWGVLDSLIAKREYFILHAPRQSGKTTSILEYVKHVNKGDKYIALYLSTEPAHTAKNEIERVLYWLLSQFETEIRDQLADQDKALSFLVNALKERPIAENALYRFLHLWAQSNTKPLAIFFDEIDGLVEDSLVSLLKQLRTGYTKRPEFFPQSICLIGVRNLTDYKLQSVDEIEKGILLSPFNIVADALVLKNFTKEEVAALYLQHTQETGQIFTDDALAYAYTLTQGQPWLVNALAYQTCFRDVPDWSTPITKEAIERAKDQLILRRDTHISALVDKLHELRVSVIIDAIISGSDQLFFNPDDIQYVRDLGLIKENSWEIANPIYQQVIPRALTYVMQQLIPEETAWYVEPSGKLNMEKLLSSFTKFFRENADAHTARADTNKTKNAYKESFPHLLLMAYLQRIINGGGTLCREYAIGTKRVDLCIEWGKKFTYIVELKIKRGEDTLRQGLEQITTYIDLCKSDEAHLIIFDNDSTKSWDEKISNEMVSYNAKKIHVWTM